MSLVPVNLSGERETALLTLYARALDRRAPRPILGDAWADDAVGRIAYDWRRLRGAEGQRANVAIRTRQLDDWTRRFVGQHPDAVVLDLGCGLDARALRVDPPAGVDWYGVDYPDVLAVRREVLPSHPRERLLGSSLTEPGWLEALPSGRSAMIVADGVLPFLSAPDVGALIDRLVRRLPSGALAFNQYTTLAARLTRLHPAIRATGASVNPGFDDPREPTRWNPRLALLEESPLVVSPYLATLPWAARLVCSAMARVPSLRRFGQLVLYRF